MRRLHWVRHHHRIPSLRRELEPEPGLQSPEMRDRFPTTADVARKTVGGLAVEGDRVHPHCHRRHHVVRRCRRHEGASRNPS